MCARNTLAADRSQAGAALVTVILISTLLLTASIALLTSLGAGARETTDVLSETKAYYAAESGLQATINRLRNDTNTAVTYSAVAADPTLITSPLYNWPTTGGSTRSVIGQTAASYSPTTGSAFEISITDPDPDTNPATASTAYRTLGWFDQGDGTYAATRVVTSGSNSLTLSYVGQSSTTVAPSVGTQFGG